MKKIITRYPKRKIIRLGYTSLAVVIPIDFVREHHIKKEDFVEILYDGKNENSLKLIFKSNRKGKGSNYQEVQE